MGKVGPGLRRLCGQGTLGLPTSPPAGHAPPTGGEGPVLQKEVGLVERCLAAGSLLRGPPLGCCCSLLPLGGSVCAVLSDRPFFAARHEVMLQLMRLANHCRDIWARHLRTPAHILSSLADCFFME